MIYLIIFYTTKSILRLWTININRLRRIFCVINSFIDNPQTFITTIGLYNDNNDLVAVAKLSQPVTKDFTKEALIRVKLDY